MHPKILLLALAPLALGPQESGTAPPARSLSGHSEPITQLALSVNGKVVVTAAGSELFAWDLKKERELWRAQVKVGPVVNLAAGDELVAYNPGKAMAFTYSTETGEEHGGIGAPNVQDDSRCLAIDPKDGWIWTGTDAGVGSRVLPTNPQSGWKIVKVPTRVVTALAVDAKGGTIAMGGEDSTIRFVAAKSARPDEDEVFEGHTGAVGALVFDPKGKLLASGTDTGEVRVWKVSKGDVEHDLLAGGPGVTRLAIDSKGKRLAAGFEDGAIRLWDLKRGEEVLVLPGDEAQAVTGLAFAHKGETLLAARSTPDLTLWDLSDL